ncbi:TPA: DNA polymerase III subunit alpha, partial [Candidatus Peregrinibacteria bacterium]|nr:DNA polymerase III subunit alpha [Candidatus Peregrinibacteria bacterium]
MAFTHLHTHSEYSFLDSLPSVKELAKAAKNAGQTHVALTDRANMHGAIEFYKACVGEDIKPVIGCEMFMAPRSRLDKEAGKDSKRQRIILIAKNNKGYENLLKLVSTAFQDGFYYVARIDMDILNEFSEDLIAIIPRSGGLITPYLESGDLEKAEKLLQNYKNIFAPENLFLETTPRPNLENEQIFQKNYKLILEKIKISPVATNDIRYISPEDKDVHDTLICMQYTLQKKDRDRISYKDLDMSFWSEEQMNAYFSDIPHAIQNTQIIADQCSYEFDFSTNLIPKWEVTPNFRDEAHLLRFLCEEGIRQRFGGKYRGCYISDVNFQEIIANVDNSSIKISETNLEQKEYDEILERLTYELKIIGDMGFNAYFLIVGDFVQWAKTHDIVVGPGRGSAAGAIVAFLLEITDLNPLTYGLFFERFLNPERVSMPDIDIDFADTGREAVLEYVRNKYGRDKVANVATFGTMAARAATKDVARVYGLPFSEANELVKLISDKPGTKLQAAKDDSTELQEALNTNSEWNDIYDTAMKLEGNIRHISVHACAVMITPEPIMKYCPLQPAPKDENILITQFQAKPLEQLGLLKMDFLGLRNLSILENTMKLAKERHNIDISILDIDMKDEKAFKLLTDGFTTGVFQLESAGMTRYLKELKPTRFEDLIAMVSLYRPGPMKFIPDYIAGSHNPEMVSYPDPSLERILKETFGIAIYQEQILEIAKVFAGFTLGGADLLRRAIGKKIESELLAQRDLFIDGSIANGHTRKLAESIFDDVIVPFSGYGFNKSHAACYALIAYQTAYLKARYPVEFMTALLMSDAENTDRVILDIEECRSLGIKVLPPSVEESDFSFSVIDDSTIRFGLNAIKGIGESVVEKLIEAQILKKKRFLNFVEFLETCGPNVINKKSLEALAKGGALIRLEDTGLILDNVEKILQFTKDSKTTNNAAQDDLFGAFDIEVETAKLELEPAKDVKGKKIKMSLA